MCSFCSMLQGVYVSTFVILSPTDYQSILAELQSPAVLHSNPNFLEPDLPVTPNPFLAPSPQHHYSEPDTPLLAESQLPPPPWSPEVDGASGEPDSPLKSPPRPCELALSVPVFQLPDPLPANVRKPHIALNDQLLLSEEEDKSCPEQTHKPKTHLTPGLCEPDIDMAFSTSSPSLSSISSITPSTPERVHIGDGLYLTSAPMFVQDDICLKKGKKEVTEEIEKVVEMATAELEGNIVVEKWIEQELIQNVKIKCEMVIQDKLKLAKEGYYAKDEVDLTKEQLALFQEGTVCKVEEVKNVLYPSEEQIVLIKTEHEVERHSPDENAETEKEGICGTVQPEINIKGSKEGSIHQEEGMNKKDCHFLIKRKEKIAEIERDIKRKSQVEQAAKDQAIIDPSPQAGLVECLAPLSGSNEAAKDQAIIDPCPQARLVECLATLSGSNKEEQGCKSGYEIKKEEALASALEEAKKDQGSEVEENEEETNGTRIVEMLRQVEQAEKDLCSLSGWHSDSSSVNVEPPTPGRSISSDLLDKRERYTA